MVGFGGLRKLMKPKESKIRRLQKEGVKERYNTDLLKYIFVNDGRARMFNGKQYLEVRTDIPDGTYDYDGNRIDGEFDSKMFNFLNIDGVKPEVKFTVSSKDFLEALREVNTENRLYFYIGYNKVDGTLGFYTKVKGERRALAEIKAFDCFIPEDFECAIHNHENLSEILALNSVSYLTIFVDEQRDLIKFYSHDIKLLMGCNSKNFELG